MSLRDGPVGASNRADLFVSARKTDRNSDEGDGHIKGNNDGGLNHDDGQNPLQIEHVMGYAGDYRQTVLALKKSGSDYMKSLGCLVLIENLLDSHNQKLLRGHDMEVFQNSPRPFMHAQMRSLI